MVTLNQCNAAVPCTRFIIKSSQLYIRGAVMTDPEKGGKLSKSGDQIKV